jgi:hypothetical protein
VLVLEKAADGVLIFWVMPRWKAMAGQRSHRRRSGKCINGGLGWLEVECNRCKTRASLPLDAIRRPRDTPIWKLEAALKCATPCVGNRQPFAPRQSLSSTSFQYYPG